MSLGRVGKSSLAAKGRIGLRVVLKVRLKATRDGQRLSLAIPEVGQTRLDLELPQRVVEATVGATEPVALSRVPETQRTRLTAELTARPRLDLRWRFETEAAAQVAPLLTLQGDIAIDISPGWVRTHSSWIIHSLRGATRDLEIRLDPEEEVLELELDGQPSPPSSLEQIEGADSIDDQTR